MAVGGIYGLSGSGLDIDSMVKVGMMSKQNQLDKLQQTYTKNEWKKEAYLDIYNKVNEFNLKKLTDYKLSSNMNARSATSSNDAIKATASSSTPIGSYTVEVKSTATKAYLDGHATLNFDTDGKLASLNSTIGNVSYNLSSLSNTNTTHSFTLTGVSGSATISFDSSTTIYDLVSSVNNSKTGVSAIYDSKQNTFSFYTSETGENQKIEISSTDETALNLLNAMDLYKVSTNSETGEIAATVAGVFTSSNTISASGTNAVVLIDGKPLTGEDAYSNSITVKGMKFDFSNVTESTTARVTVAQDTEKIVENVKSFVEGYNELLDSIYDAYRESPNSSYKPLTDAQKAEMTEDQIKKWEEKAKSGMLYHDQTLRKIIDDVRNAVTNTISDGGDYDSIYKIGISTTGLYGQLTLDEEKLRDALADDPNSVYNVFGKNGTTNDGSGIAVRLSKALNDATTNMAKVAGRNSSTSSDSTLDTLMRSMQERISNFRKMMNTFEDNLYKKYDAMESALANLGSQMNYVSSMFSA